MGRERGHCVCWPCSKIPVLGWEQPLGWLKKNQTISRDKTPTPSLAGAHSSCQLGQRGECSLLGASQHLQGVCPKFQGSSALPWPVGALLCWLPCSRGARGAELAAAVPPPWDALREEGSILRPRNGGGRW